MRRAAVLLGAFLLYIGPALADWLPDGYSQVGIVMFGYQNGATPAQGVAYSLNQTVPIQKIDSGYLIVPMFSDGTPLQPVFLKTKANLNEGQELTGWGKCIGYTEYEGINGFTQKVFAFEAVGGPR